MTESTGLFGVPKVGHAWGAALILLGIIVIAVFFCWIC